MKRFVFIYETKLLHVSFVANADTIKLSQHASFGRSIPASLLILYAPDLGNNTL